MLIRKGKGIIRGKRCSFERSGSLERDDVLIREGNGDH